jgi:hypothetical protein
MGEVLFRQASRSHVLSQFHQPALPVADVFLNSFGRIMDDEPFRVCEFERFRFPVYPAQT